MTSANGGPSGSAHANNELVSQFFGTLADVSLKKAAGDPVAAGRPVIDPITRALLGFVDGNGNVVTFAVTNQSDTFSNALLSSGPGVSKKLAEKATPYTATGSTFFIDPLWGGPFNGTFTQPYNAITQVTFAANITVLQKSGTSLTLLALFAPSVSGTSTTAAIVYGVYDGVSGTRISGAGPGIATLNVNGTAAVCTKLLNTNFWCFDGIKFTGSSASTSNGQVWVTGTSANNQFLSCDMSNHGHDGLHLDGTGVGNYAEGCTAQNNAAGGIGNLLAADNSNNFAYNVASNNGQYGIACFDLGTFKYSGEISGNTLQNNGSAGSAYGVWIFATSCTAKIHNNLTSGQVINIFLQGNGVNPDFGGTVVENNDINNAGYFGVQAYGISGTTLPVLIQYNRIRNSGSYNNVTSATAEHFARGVEVFGVDTAHLATNVVIRYNYVTGSFNFIADGSEGVGIGLDNNSNNCQVYGNICYANGGNGIQLNTNTTGSSVHSNLLVGNVTARNLVFPGNAQSEIYFVACPNTKVFNNTVVAYSATYCIAESGTFASRTSAIQNNLCINGGIAVNAANVCTTNLIEGSKTPVINAVTGATLSTTNLLAAFGASGAKPTFYIPPAGSLCDKAGVVVDATALSLFGAPFGAIPPIGASPASF